VDPTRGGTTLEWSSARLRNVVGGYEGSWGVRLDGLLAEARAEFDRHLAECPWCVAYLDSYKKTIQLARAAFAAAEDAPPPRDAPEELIQAVVCARSRDK
jgi:hypothetical protein